MLFHFLAHKLAFPLLNFDYWATWLTVSPLGLSVVINSKLLRSDWPINIQSHSNYCKERGRLFQATIIVMCQFIPSVPMVKNNCLWQGKLIHLFTIGNLFCRNIWMFVQRFCSRTKWRATSQENGSVHQSTSR